VLLLRAYANKRPQDTESRNRREYQPGLGPVAIVYFMQLTWEYELSMSKGDRANLERYLRAAWQLQRNPMPKHSEVSRPEIPLKIGLFLGNPFVQGVAVFIARAVAFSGKLDSSGTGITIVIAAIVGVIGIWTHISRKLFALAFLLVSLAGLFLFNIYLTKREISYEPSELHQMNAEQLGQATEKLCARLGALQQKYNIDAETAMRTGKSLAPVIEELSKSYQQENLARDVRALRKELLWRNKITGPGPYFVDDMLLGANPLLRIADHLRDLLNVQH
jgi:hypothetical protein